MDKTFDKNYVKPTDPNFVYDKRKEFKVVESYKDSDSWDEDEQDEF